MNEIEDDAELDIIMRATIAFRAVALAAQTEDGNRLVDRVVETYMASDGRTVDEQLWSLAMVGIRVTAMELRKAGRPVPPSVVEAIDAPTSSDPRAGGWTAVLAELDGDPTGSRSALCAVRDRHGAEGVTDAVAFLARLYRDAREVRRAVQAVRGRAETRQAGDDTP